MSHGKIKKTTKAKGRSRVAAGGKRVRPVRRKFRSDEDADKGVKPPKGSIGDRKLSLSLAVIQPQEIRVVQTGVKVWDRWAPWSKWELDQIEELAQAVKRSPFPRTKELAARCLQILEKKKV